MEAFSLETIRCPICFLIPKVLYTKFNFEYENTFIFTILCPNNHFSRINDKKFRKNNIKFSLNDIKCTKCNKNQLYKYYCKKCYYILCDSCKDEHKHKIFKLNEIDNICFCHEEQYILYCKNCKIGLCDKCIKLKEHKGHEINELKHININKIKNHILKMKKKINKKIEKDKKLDIKNFKLHINKEYKSISEIEKYYNNFKCKKFECIDFISDLINDYELYIKNYKIPNYYIYLNLNLFSFLINEDSNRTFRCENYEKYLSRINEYNFKFYDSKLELKKLGYDRKYEEIKYCGIYKDINGQFICVYYLDNKLNFLSLETSKNIKEIEFELKEIHNINLKFYKIKNIEFLLLINYSKYSFSVYNIENNSNITKIFFYETKLTELDYMEAYIFYYNSKIYISCFTPFEVYNFCLLNNELVNKLNFNEKIEFQ